MLQDGKEEETTVPEALEKEKRKCVCVCVNRSLVWAIWLNCEVVEFQASVIDCYILRLFRLLLTTFIPTHPTCLSRFLDHSISSSSYPPPPHQYHSTSNHHSLFVTLYPHPLPAWYVVHLDFYPTLHPLASTTRLCALHQLLVSIAMYYVL